jgi:hypothetical protein
LTGLTNNVKYVFTVVATNEVGDSQPSVASNEITPDEKPSPPDVPTVKAGDKDLAITWTPAKTEGSPVKHYNLEISPPPANGVAVKNEVSGLSYTWPGLSNGVKYKVRAQAVNELGPVRLGFVFRRGPPGGYPWRSSGAPSTAVVSSVGSQNQLRADWAEPDINGDPIKNYYVTMSGGTGAAQTQDHPRERPYCHLYRRQLRSCLHVHGAGRKQGRQGRVSAASAPRRATGKLGTVGNVSATPTNTNQAGEGITIDFVPLSAAQRNGSSASEVSYTYNAGGRTGVIQPGQSVYDVTNGRPVAVTVTAHSTVAPSSDASAPVTATPYGNPGSPAAQAENGDINQKSVTFRWMTVTDMMAGPPNAGRRGVDIAVTKIRIDNGPWETVASSGTRTINTAGWEETHTFSVQNFNSIATPGPVSTTTGKSGKQGQWTTTMSPGAVERSCSFTLGGSNYDPNKFTCDGKGGNTPPWMYSTDQGQIVVRCYIDQSDNWTGMHRWWRIEAGSYRNAGRYIIATHTHIPEPTAVGAPHC